MALAISISVSSGSTDGGLGPSVAWPPAALRWSPRSGPGTARRRPARRRRATGSGSSRTYCGKTSVNSWLPGITAIGTPSVIGDDQTGQAVLRNHPGRLGAGRPALDHGHLLGQLDRPHPTHSVTGSTYPGQGLERLPFQTRPQDALSEPLSVRSVASPASTPRGTARRDPRREDRGKLAAVARMKETPARGCKRARPGSRPLAVEPAPLRPLSLQGDAPVGHSTCQLGPRPHTDLAIDPGEVRLDGAHARMKLRCHFSVGSPGNDQGRDASFACRQRVVGAHPWSGASKLLVGSGFPTKSSEREKGVARRRQHLSCCAPPACAPQRSAGDERGYGLPRTAPLLAGIHRLIARDGARRRRCRPWSAR